MKMIKKTNLILLITFVFIFLISINSFAINDFNSQYEQSTQITQITNENDEMNLNNNISGDDALPTKQKTELLNMKENTRTTLQKYQERYKNNAVYGFIAYILNVVRLASIPFFIIGILISVVYEYIIGMKRREMVRKGRGMRITMGSLFVTAQVLPLIFVIVINFWGN